MSFCSCCLFAIFKPMFTDNLFQQGRAAPLAYCTQRSYCHRWEGEADHLPVPAKHRFELLTKLSFESCTVAAIWYLFTYFIFRRGTGLSREPWTGLHFQSELRFNWFSQVCETYLFLCWSWYLIPTGDMCFHRMSTEHQLRIHFFYWIDDV